MGILYYDDWATPIPVEDHLLAHLKVVIAAKLRRGESFLLSWRHLDDEELGRTSVWLHPAVPWRVVLDDAAPITMHRDLLERLTASAATTQGIVLTSEDSVAAAEPPQGP